MLAPPPAPTQPCQFATVFLRSVDHLGHTVEVSKCAPWASPAHVLPNEAGKHNSDLSSSPAVRTISAQFIFHVNKQ